MFDNTDDLLAAMQEALGESGDGDGVTVGSDGMIEGSFTDLSADAPATAAEDGAAEDDLLAAMSEMLGTTDTPATAEAPAEDTDGVDDALLAAMSDALGTEAPAATEDAADADGVDDALLAAMR